MAVKKSPETEASVMATRDSRPVREEVIDKVSGEYYTAEEIGSWS
jgi:hypothetical protein